MSALEKAMQLRGQIGNREQPHIRGPKKNVGSGLTSAIGGASTGLTLASAAGATGVGLPIAAGIGALIGGAEYFSS